ncbi:hypothetical protein AHiyo4_11350 [Arthrobacter sp. Hiyo4]|nr:hypothetical protein AHiyo4_11350 [Arthrobacter sp. Hiyo4]
MTLALVVRNTAAIAGGFIKDSAAGPMGGADVLLCPERTGALSSCVGHLHRMDRTVIHFEPALRPLAPLRVD